MRRMNIKIIDSTDHGRSFRTEYTRFIYEKLVYTLKIIIGFYRHCENTQKTLLIAMLFRSRHSQSHSHSHSHLKMYLFRRRTLLRIIIRTQFDSFANFTMIYE